MINYPATASLINDLSNDDLSLCITGIGERVGGLGVYSAVGLTILDRISTTGLSTFGDLVARAITTVHLHGADGTQFAEVALYDETGLLRLERLDGIGELHDISLEGDAMILVSTGNDRIVRYQAGQGFQPSFETLLTSKRQIDTWHVNCVTPHNGELFATAFGRRSGWTWRRSGKAGAAASANETGELFNVTTGEIVAKGFTKPHSPRRWKDSWILADSGKGSVVVIPDDGDFTTIDCGGWTRGLVIVGDHALVGVSVRRGAQAEEDSQESQLKVIDLIAKTVIATEPLPFEEVYELVTIPNRLIAGLQRGVATNALRIYERSRAEDLWPRAEDNPLTRPLPEQDWFATITAQIPPTVQAAQELEISVTLTYLGSTPVASIGDTAVSLGWYWDNAAGEEQGRCGFGQILTQGSTTTLMCPITVPYEIGTHQFHIGMVQESVAWFEGGIDLEILVSSKS